MKNSLQVEIAQFSSSAKVLFIDDDPNMLRLIQANLSDADFSLLTAASGREGIALCQVEEPDLVFVDLEMPEMDGFAVLRQLRKEEPDLTIIFFTAHDDINIASEALSAGAYDFVQKPFEINRIRVTIQNALRYVFLMRRLASAPAEESNREEFPQIIGKSGKMQEIFTSLRKVLKTSVTVLLQGESGTGKEIIAKAIHRHSPERKKYPFAAVNCAALPENLLESELFGHEKGAFTGALEKRIGIFEYANGGSILLDEIGEMPLSMQTKLLRVLQEREFNRLGSNQTIKTDVRIISATNKDLHQRVKDGAFREDLYYRLAVFPMQLPPLRERLEDILPLTRHFLEKHARQLGIEVQPVLSRSVFNVLLNYRWPGNVRELENTMERALIEAQGEMILPRHLAPAMIKEANTGHGQIAENDLIGTLPEIVYRIEEMVIRRAVEEQRGNLSQVAKILDIGRTTLYRKLQQYGLEAEQEDS
jgi:two-component system response regulator AtoC